MGEKREAEDVEREGVGREIVTGPPDDRRVYETKREDEQDDYDEQLDQEEMDEAWEEAGSD